jgi:hypothetical protein
MKRLFIFALMTMAASSSFAMGDILNCINGRVNVTTARYMNDEKNLRLSASFMVDDLGTFHSVVETKSSLMRPGQKAFVGKTSDGRTMKLVVKGFNKLKGTLTIDGLPAEEGFVCKEQILFEM